MNRILLGIFGLAVIVISFAGCNSSSTPPAPVTLTVTPASALLFSTQSIQLTAADSVGASDVAWSVPAGSGATVDATGNFTAPAVTQNTSITVTATSQKDPTKTQSAVITVLASGQVTATANPQVALYTLTPPAGLNVFIQFGTDTSYKLKTWTQPGPATGSLSLFVAGMLASTNYHMRAVVQATDGTFANDLDHTFTIPALPPALIPAMTVTTSPGMTPQPGVEMLNLLGFTVKGTAQLAAVDLSGNVIWTYSGHDVQGVHLLPNGDFIIGGSPDILLEIDLAGKTIRQETNAQLNASLTTAGIAITSKMFHHDVIQLPNGRWIALIQLGKLCSDIPNCPAPATTTILGDALAELIPQSDGTFQLGWVWNSFDHLDITRALQGYPDWTHSNAIVYSADDHNLLLSIRHQGWVIKIDYADGAGTGNILWRLGRQGDFTLVGGTDPTDWFYAQHGPAFATANTTGIFRLAIMDNGNFRKFAPGVTCGASGAPPCNYSTAPLLEIDETAKTATIISNYKPGEYSFWGGEAQLLANGNMEGDFNAGAGAVFSDIFEVIPGNAPQAVWHLQTSTANAYRGFRMPSLYPGVQW
jgi:arylsulfate sulfotransferase